MKRETDGFLKAVSLSSSADVGGAHQAVLHFPVDICTQFTETKNESALKKEMRRQIVEIVLGPRSWNPAKGTRKRAGWRMREIKETKRFFKSLGAGRVNRMAMAASAATTYVRIIHCNAISWERFTIFNFPTPSTLLDFLLNTATPYLS